MTGFDNASSTLAAKETFRIPLNTAAASVTLAEAITHPKHQAIRVVSGWISVSAATTLTFKSDNQIDFLITFAAAGTHHLSRNGDGWIVTKEGEALKMLNSAPATVTGVLVAAKVGGRR